MKVTVVIPNYNGLRFLKDCLDAMERQTMKEVVTVVIDNGSTDESVPFMEANYPWVKIVRMKENTGFCHAVNEGIKLSETPYVLLLNNDTEVEPRFVEELYKAIDASEDIFSVSSKMLNFVDRDIMDDAGDGYSAIGWQYQRGVGRHEKYYMKPANVFSACAGAAIYRKSVFEEIGYFDKSHFAYLEDMDMGYRAKVYGYRNMYCPKARVYHVGSGSSGSKYNDFKVSHSSRNSIYLVYKNMPLLQLIINVPALAAGFFVKWIFFVKIGFGKTYFKGIIEGIRTCGKNCRKVPFKIKHIGNYIKIEWELICGTFVYAYELLRRKCHR